MYKSYTVLIDIFTGLPKTLFVSKSTFNDKESCEKETPRIHKELQDMIKQGQNGIGQTKIGKTLCLVDEKAKRKLERSIRFMETI